MATPSSSESPPSLSDKTIQILKALHEHAFETMDIEYPWYMLWNECFTQLNMLYSDNDIHLTVGPQQQFTKRKHRKLSSAPAKVPNTRSNYSGGQSSPLHFLDDDDDCPMADTSFGSHVTDDGPKTAFLEKEEAHRIPDFGIFRLFLKPSTKWIPPLPSAVVENKPLRIPGPKGIFMKDSEENSDPMADYMVEIIMDETFHQAREQLECLFEEYPLTPGQPDPLPEVYHMIIVGGWFRIEAVTRESWKEFPASDLEPTYMFEGDGDKKINSKLLKFWPKLRYQKSS